MTDHFGTYGEHGGESRGILHLYSDRTGKNIRHYFLILSEFSYGKTQIPYRFFVASRYLRGVYMHAVFFHTTSSKDRMSLLEVVLKTTAC